MIEILKRENKRLRIAFGKYIAGYRPGDELWSNYDQWAFDMVCEKKEVAIENQTNNA